MTEPKGNNQSTPPQTNRGGFAALLILLIIACILWLLYFTLPGVRVRSGTAASGSPTSAMLDSVFHACISEFGLDDSCFKRIPAPIKKEDSLRYGYILNLPSDVPAPVFIAQFQVMLSGLNAQLTAYEKEQHSSGWIEIATGRYIKFYCDIRQGKEPRANTRECVVLVSGLDELSTEVLDKLVSWPGSFTVLLPPASGAKELARRFEMTGKEVLPLLLEDSPEIEFQLNAGHSVDRIKAYANAVIGLFPGRRVFYYNGSHEFFNSAAFQALRAYLKKKGVNLEDLAKARHAVQPEEINNILTQHPTSEMGIIRLSLSAGTYLESARYFSKQSRRGWKFTTNSSVAADTAQMRTLR